LRPGSVNAAARIRSFGSVAEGADEMRLRRYLAFAIVAALVVPGALRAAEEGKAFKYAYVNMERVVDEYVLFKEARDGAQKKIEEARVEDQAQMDEYQKKLAALEEKLEGPLAPEAKVDAVNDYKTTYEEALDFRNSALAKYKRIERDAFEPAYKKVYEKIESYAVKEDYEVVFDYSAILLYADEKQDITDEIIKELNEEAGISK
jgi:Skp family chaperone for outer membrane proteins